MRKAGPALLLFMLTLTGCGERVPVEIQQAMKKQADELQQVRMNYKSAVDILFAQIRVLQLSILDEKEKQIRQKYTIGRKIVDGQIAFYDKDGNPFPPTGDPDKDIIPVNLNKRITDTFEQMRIDSAEKLDQAKQEFLKLDNNIEIAQQINAAVADYITSLINARNAQRELGTTLLTRLGSIPTAGNLSGRLLNLIVPDTTPLNTLQPANP
jgi:predicted small lipoprotein YifL